MHTALGIENAYTLEMTYCGDEDSSLHYTQDDTRDMSKQFVKSLYEWSKIDTPKYAELKEEISQTLSLLKESKEPEQTDQEASD